ncbi:MAG: T9SS type A sorting domain-containing protein, partial [Paludibacteraceae bacterium]|nr:T9SS type A sorting domain-containing protein [Paludibacteraceae bacterium]
YEVKNVQDVVTISATFNESSSVEDLSSSAQRIYPNPVKDCLYIENGESCTEVELLSADGKVLRREKGRKKLSLEGLHSGIYTLRLKNRDNVYINKIIKK